MRRVAAAVVGVFSGTPLLFLGVFVLVYSADSRRETSIDIAGSRLDADLVGALAVTAAGLLILASAVLWRRAPVDVFSGRVLRPRSGSVRAGTKAVPSRFKDANFDALADSFADLYRETQGRIRLEVVLEDLLEAVPALRGGGVAILDVGGGTGELAIRLARLGNSITLVDPSSAMLARARTAIEAAEVQQRVHLVRAPIAEFEDTSGSSFSLVICHAVLNWVAEPRETLMQVSRRLDEEGRLSLMYGNRDGWIWERLHSGKLSGVLEDALRPIPRAPGAGRRQEQRPETLPAGWSREGWGDHGVPLSEEIVRTWLAELGLIVESKAGVRMFHDHLPNEARVRQFTPLLELEKRLRRREPFASLGRLTHVVCRRG